MVHGFAKRMKPYLPGSYSIGFKICPLSRETLNRCTLQSMLGHLSQHIRRKSRAS